ncbi:MAG: hypothetical protein KME21_19695 [Desmonostoc vinosum HA7617-LM4]|nr:hypothetical protein [Desmonostoc vinosum HA7617-LM4]
MTNGETRQDNAQSQPAVEVATSSEATQAQLEFLEIKQALTDRQAKPDPLPGWILPRVDSKAAASNP